MTARRPVVLARERVLLGALMRNRRSFIPKEGKKVISIQAASFSTLFSDVRPLMVEPTNMQDLMKNHEQRCIGFRRPVEFNVENRVALPRLA